MDVEIVTLFPELFGSFLAAEAGLLGKAVAAGLVRVHFTNPRDFATGAHRKVDDQPYGGGAGMVLMAPPLLAAIESVEAARGSAHRVLLSAAGRPLTSARVRELAALPRILIVCGRYEGVDARLAELAGCEEVSIGDFVLMGGEVAAMALVEAAARFVPGVLGDAESAEDESFTAGLVEYPHYTRPPEVRGASVPAALTSGHHAEIRAWREAQAQARTRARRPELWARHPAAAAARAGLAARTHVALVHHPVYDKHHQIVTTAVTNLDIHDLARAATTFGLAGYHVVTPIGAQRELVERILGHWRSDEGRAQNDQRTLALDRVRVVPDLDGAIASVAAAHGAAPLVVATAARAHGPTLAVADLAGLADAEPARPMLLLFGTGHGLADEVFPKVHASLHPIRGASDYNHLSVRAAAAIVLDRLFGYGPK